MVGHTGCRRRVYVCEVFGGWSKTQAGAKHKCEDCRRSGSLDAAQRTAAHAGPRKPGTKGERSSVRTLDHSSPWSGAPGKKGSHRHPSHRPTTHTCTTQHAHTTRMHSTHITNSHSMASVMMHCGGPGSNHVHPRVSTGHPRTLRRRRSCKPGKRRAWPVRSTGHLTLAVEMTTHRSRCAAATLWCTEKTHNQYMRNVTNSNSKELLNTSSVPLACQQAWQRKC